MSINHNKLYDNDLNEILFHQHTDLKTPVPTDSLSHIFLPQYIPKSIPPHFTYDSRGINVNPMVVSNLQTPQDLLNFITTQFQVSSNVLHTRVVGIWTDVNQFDPTGKGDKSTFGNCFIYVLTDANDIAYVMCQDICNDLNTGNYVESACYFFKHRASRVTTVYSVTVPQIAPLIAVPGKNNAPRVCPPGGKKIPVNRGRIEHVILFISVILMCFVISRFI